MFRGIREYTPEDPMNRINWKASARNGSLMVNQHNSAVSGNVCILLDVEDETVWKYEEIHEEGIRLAAAVAESFLSRGIEVGLITRSFFPDSPAGAREKSSFSVLPGSIWERGAGSSLIVWQRKKSFFWQKRVFVY